MTEQGVTYVEKACAYVTRNGSGCWCSRGRNTTGSRYRRGRSEPSEGPREALCREVIEESGLAHLRGDTAPGHRRLEPPAVPAEAVRPQLLPRPRAGERRTRGPTLSPERARSAGIASSSSGSTSPTDAAFALDLDDYLHAIDGVDVGGHDGGVTAD